jgi:alpha-D-xyloside xylohydrolase
MRFICPSCVAENDSWAAFPVISLPTVEQPNWGKLPALQLGTDSRVENNIAIVATNEGDLRVSLHRFGARLRIGGDVIDYDILVGDMTPLPISMTSREGSVIIAGGEFQLTLQTSPLNFILRKNNQIIQSSPSDAHFIRQFRLPPFAKTEAGWFISLELGHETAVYGLGEKWGKLDKRGQLLRSYNQDALGVNAEWSYKNTPFAWSPDGWGLFVHTSAPVTHAVGFAPWSQRSYAVHVENGPLDLFLLAESNGADFIETYTALTGRAGLPPPWSHGVILSKAYYKTADEILEVAREVRARNMPCEVITFDGRAWQDTDTRFAFEWDAKRYPDPKIVIDQLKAMDFKICVWEYPLISVHNKLFDELASKGWLLKDARTGEAYRYTWDPEPFGAVLTQLPESGLLDFTNPDAFKYWRDRHKELFDLGVDMIKPDFGEQIEPNMLAHNGTQGDALHNIYALLYNRCVHEAAQKYAHDGGFLFSRSAWSGQQRYPAQWGGDPQADWGGLAASIRGALSWGMSGGPFFATDVGGFYRDTRDPVLYVRWLQVAIFSAHIRLHGIGPREPWSYGLEAEVAAMAALKLRGELSDDLLCAVAASVANGLPVMRAMVLAFPEDRLAWGFEHQFLFGPDILVAPCLCADGVVEVYIPAGTWQHIGSGRKYAAGQVHRLTLTLQEMAVFRRI